MAGGALVPMDPRLLRPARRGEAPAPPERPPQFRLLDLVLIVGIAACALGVGNQAREAASLRARLDAVEKEEGRLNRRVDSLRAWVDYLRQDLYSLDERLLLIEHPPEPPGDEPCFP